MNRPLGLAARQREMFTVDPNLPKVSFEECLNKFFELEVLPDSELLTCDYCKKLRKVSK